VHLLEWHRFNRKGWHGQTEIAILFHGSGIGMVKLQKLIGDLQMIKLG
jgi:hypothetical protein